MRAGSRKRPVVASFLFWLVAASAHAQTNAAAKAPPGKLASLTIAGNSIYPAQAIEQATGLKRGDTVDAALLDQAKDRLLATDLFSSVTYESRYNLKPVTYAVTFRLTEFDNLFPLRFERLPAPEAAILDYLRQHVPLFHDRIPGSAPVLERYSAAIQEFLAQTGKREKIRGSVSQDDPRQLTVVFAPAAPAPVIAKVEVSGNKAIESAVLLRALNENAIGQPYSETRLQQILDQTIRPIYAAKGFAAVSFPELEARPAENVTGYRVRIGIQEGPRFVFGSAAFRGSTLSRDEVSDLLPFKPGAAYNGAQAEQARQDLIQAMRRRGYLHVEGRLDTQIEDAKRAVNLRYEFTPGPQYTFQNLTIEGLDITTEPVIRRMWAVKPGKPFNPDYPKFFLQKIREAGLFDNLGETKSDYQTDDAAHTVNVRLFFRGAKTKPEGQPGAEAQTPGVELISSGL